jgi:hypothetical protein
MKHAVDFPSELPARICEKLEADFSRLFITHDSRSKNILRHYMEQIEKRRMDIETAAQRAAYDIVGKNKHEGAFTRDDRDQLPIAAE